VTDPSEPRVKRLYTHLLQLAGFAAACIAIYNFYYSPFERVEASVYYAPFEMPTPILEQLNRLEALTSPEASRKQFLSGVGGTRLVPGTGGALDQVLGNVATYVKTAAPVIGHSADYLFKGYWHARIRNSGSRAASSTVLHFPTEVSASVSRDGRGPTTPPVKALAIPVGNLQGGEEIVVDAWSLAAPSDDLANKITLTHDLGAGRVKVARHD
jgi:hypothetical protein